MSNISPNKLEIYAEDFCSFLGITKFSFIRKTPNGKWEVVSRKGKSLGEYDTKELASKRLRQIEFFKHKKASQENNPLSYSSTVRLLNDQFDNDTVKKFQKLFKENFDRLYLEGNNEPEDEALEIAISSIDHFKKNASAIEMGDPNFAGKKLSDLIRFLLRRIPQQKRQKALQSMKKKIYMINEYELSRKKTPPHSSMGQVLTLIKLILLEHNSEYVRNVLNAIVRNL